MANQFGEKIKHIREEKHLLQRQIASKMDMDCPMLSKIERGERKAKRDQVLLLGKILGVGTEELLTLWLADQVLDVVKNEELALEAMQVAEEEIIYINSKTK